MLRSPKEWPRWVWLALLVAIAVPLLLGARQLGAWPFGGPQPETVSAPLPFATKTELEAVSVRLKAVSSTAASKADIAELQADLDELKAVVRALEPPKKGKKQETGSVR